MTIKVDFDQTELDESPATISYVILALLSFTFGFHFKVAEDAIGNEVIIVVDDQTDTEHIQLEVSPMMGTLLCSILQHTYTELSEDGDQPWTFTP